MVIWTSFFFVTLKKSDIFKSFESCSCSTHSFNINLMFLFQFRLIEPPSSKAAKPAYYKSWLILPNYFVVHSHVCLLSEFILSLSFMTTYYGYTLHAPCSILHTSFLSTSMNAILLVCTLSENKVSNRALTSRFLSVFSAAPLVIV